MKMVLMLFTKNKDDDCTLALWSFKTTWFNIVAIQDNDYSSCGSRLVLNDLQVYAITNLIHTAKFSTKIFVKSKIVYNWNCKLNNVLYDGVLHGASTAMHLQLMSLLD